MWLDDIASVDHVSTGLARLIWQYRGDQPRIQAFLESLLDEVQSIEDAAYQVLTGIWPRTAIGDQLDVLGKIVGQKRYGLVDEAYRVFILGRIYVNVSDGKLPQYLYLISDILNYQPVQAYEAKWHQQWPSAALRIAVAGVTYPDPMVDLLFDLKGGGIYLEVVYSERAEGTIFQTSSLVGTDEVSTTEGTTNLAGATGGYLSSMRWYR